ncbi:VC0807 family protein [Actinopolyspora erythraea]|uniref:VC0807 family protein n=1 Tax=Actinopolyspora erythraea TaxID=414996 RepID=UPI0006944A73|nr:VC0807 family protein [Actinopolyspora erythraea]
MHDPTTVQLDGLRTHLLHAGKKLLETTLAPLGLFYLLLQLTDLTGGLFAALGWAVAAVVCRLVLRAPVPAVLLLTTSLLVVRTVVGVVSQSAFLYFLQPSLQNFLIAGVLLATLPFERTFLARLADDFCVFPPALMGHAVLRRFFRRVSLLWAAVFIANGAAALWMLAEHTVGQFLLVSTIGSYGLVAAAALVSLLWFRRELRGHGIRLRIGDGASRLLPNVPRPAWIPPGAGVR